jgi:hypothetical protein
MAGIQALVNQKNGSFQGNPSAVYYRLAAANSCNSSLGDPGNCIFHYVTEGDIDVNCSGTQNCFGAVTTTPGGGRRGPGFGGGSSSSVGGVLSLSESTLQDTYPAASGWSFATGLGSVNAHNLVMGWNK